MVGHAAHINVQAAFENGKKQPARTLPAAKRKNDEIMTTAVFKNAKVWGSDSFVIENSTPKKAQNARKHKHAA